MKDSIFLKKIAFSFLSLFLASFFFSCASSEVEVADGVSSIEIVQFAQTAFDKGNTKKALKYYDILLQRYGMDTAIYIEGKFEIAHIYVKQKKFSKAEPILNEILDIYNSSQPGQFPGAYRKLAQKDLEKIQNSKNSGS
ncbi:hypothetical protein [Treponema sp.]|uniref:hypothetical protein n=1 Tax=Treponema sp. TaxID=166 RepID=UPI003F045429